jgi:hypothetical protein
MRTSGPGKSGMTHFHPTSPSAAKELERTDLSNPVIGAEHRTAIVAAGAVLKKAEVIPDGTNIDGTFGARAHYPG